MTYEIVLRALQDPTRRAIIERLRRGASSVGELAAGLPVSQPAVSQHLGVLREAGLVASRREGRRRIYVLRAEGLVPLRVYVDAMWTEALAAYAAGISEDGRQEG